MTDNEPMMLYTATYDSVSSAMTDLDAIEQLNKDQVIGKYASGLTRVPPASVPGGGQGTGQGV